MIDVERGCRVASNPGLPRRKICVEGLGSRLDVGCVLKCEDR